VIHGLKNVKNMVYEKQEKLHNTQNVNFIKTMPKSDIHPKWFENTPVLCDGKPLCLIGSTKSELQVDIWLANHPFYTNSQVLIDSEGRVEKFMKKYRLDTTELKFNFKIYL
jgi:large subunit ribosomal protein L31